MRVLIIGQGYVGLTIAVSAANVGHKVLGYDINTSLVNALNSGVSHVEGVTALELNTIKASESYRATNNLKDIDVFDVVIIAVPTPLDAEKNPDLSFLHDAVNLIQNQISVESLIINESTSFPGTLRNEIAGRINGIKHLYAVSPERVDPGNSDWNTKNTPRLLGALTPDALVKAKEFYSTFCETIIEVSSPEVAEAAKIFENTFRQVNIALVNEFAQITNTLKIPVREVLAAAASKPYGFMAFNPGPGVGGHCIPIDPTYLAFVAKNAGIHAKFIELANDVNKEMPDYVVQRVSASAGGSVNGKSVVVIGVAYKPNVADTRESPSGRIIDLLREAGASVSWHDPLVNTWRGERSSKLKEYDIAVLVTKHDGVNIEDILKSKCVFDCTGTIFSVDGI
jgi:UDP-N-acetyl-D-glucosamine dehydrogenase